MSNNRRFILFLVLAAVAGALATLGAIQLTVAADCGQARALQQRVQELETRLANADSAQSAQPIAGPGVATSPADELIKDLSTRFIGDERSFAEKVRDFLAADTPQLSKSDRIGIAAKTVADMAENRDNFPDGDLVLLYNSETDPDFKRVTAQILSFRGDNRLLDAYIAQFKPSLESDNQATNRKALVALAKTHYAGAADLIIPVLKTPQVAVLLDALLALRATGNERHAPLAETLASHADPSVSWLAQDAVKNLQLLSTRARLQLTLADIGADLPPVSLQ